MVHCGGIPFFAIFVIFCGYSVYEHALSRQGFVSCAIFPYRHSAGMSYSRSSRRPTALDPKGGCGSGGSLVNNSAQTGEAGGSRIFFPGGISVRRTRRHRPSVTNLFPEHVMLQFRASRRRAVSRLQTNTPDAGVVNASSIRILPWVGPVFPQPRIEQ